MKNNNNFIKVKSSNIDKVRYKKESKELEIIFKGGSRYRYKNISNKMYEDLMDAESKGTYFNNNIRKRPDLYPCEKLN